MANTLAIASKQATQLSPRAATLALCLCHFPVAIYGTGNKSESKTKQILGPRSQYQVKQHPLDSRHRPAGGQPVRDVAARTAATKHPTVVFVGCGAASDNRLSDYILGDGENCRHRLKARFMYLITLFSLELISWS